jgi:hypothetical protein
MKKIILIFLSFLTFSCGAQKKESPVIYFSNSSPNPIQNIECEWAEENKLSLSVLNPGQSRSESFYVRDDSNFFGQVKVSWQNANGEKIAREFFFNKNNLPSFSDPTIYSYVQLYLDQEEMEITTSDAPDLAGKTRKMDRILAQYRDSYVSGKKQVETSLIRVQSQRDNSTPTWINTSY